MLSSPNVSGLKLLPTENPWSFCNSTSHCFQHWSSSSGTGSSHASFFRHHWCRIIFARRINSEANPRGSYTDETMLAQCRPMLYWNLSCSVFHWRPKALSVGSVSLSKSTFFNSFDNSESGITSSTSLLLLVHFVRWNPPWDNSSLTSLYILIADCASFVDFNKSST